MADVVMELRAERDHALLRGASLGLTEPQLDESGEVDDEEQDRVADESNASERDQPRAPKYAALARGHPGVPRVHAFPPQRNEPKPELYIRTTLGAQPSGRPDSASRRRGFQSS